MILGNPAGLWALLGVPAVIAIHLLQRRRRRLEISTFFLLPPTSAPRLSGRRIDMLRSSASLWLQLLTVAGVTWLLVEPRFPRQDYVLRAAVVLDSSASMSAFRDAALDALARRVAAAESSAALVDWTLLESAADRPTLYSGRNADAMLAAARTWEPCRGGHDARPVLETARQIVGSDGLLVFITDHEAERAAEAQLIAVGRPIDNVGFLTGGVIADGNQTSWRAVVKNHGRSAARRTLDIVCDGKRIETRVAVLEPRRALALGGFFPRGARRLDLIMESDAFALDDRMPLIVPRPKMLRVRLAIPEASQAPVARFLKTAQAIEYATDDAAADLLVTSALPKAPRSAPASIVLPEPARKPKTVSDAGAKPPIVTASHPLVRDLSWHGLLLAAPPARSDTSSARIETLLWRGETPLIELHEDRHLVFRFPITASNVDRLPAFPILLHRFLERVRDAKTGFARNNVETNEALTIAVDPVHGPLRLALEDGSIATPESREARAPARACFFRYAQGDRPRFEGAAHFADAREADLSQASSATAGGRRSRAVLIRTTRPDPFAPIVVLCLLGLVLADWTLSSRRERA